MTATIRLRAGNLAKHMKGRDLSNGQLASEIGVAHTTVGRVLRGIQAPGEKFIAGVLAAFPYLDFADLFEVVTDEAA